MIYCTLGFLLGDLFLQTFATLPQIKFIILFILCSAILCIIAKWRFKILYILAAGILGFAYSAWYAQSILNWTIPKELENKPQIIIGYIKSIPITNELGTQFDLQLENQNATVRLYWHDSLTKLKVGDHWQFTVRLKRIHGMQSPGAFDFEAWALQNKLRATGYIVKSENNQLLNHSWLHYPIDQFRQYIFERIETVLPNSATSRWLPALIVGERVGIPPDQWQVLRNTGTNHLMAIAGLHIGIIAGIAHLLTNFLWRRSTKLMLRLPAQHASAIAALLIAIIYSALAGFSIPTQRACLMLSIYIFIKLNKRNINPWHSWSLALLLVLIINPLVVLTESVWLSFVTIALIIYGMNGRLAPKGWWWHWGRVQFVIGVGLIPLSLVLFLQTSLVSFIANSIAIPWLAFLILPFCFLSSLCIAISPMITKYLLLFADKSLGILWVILTWLSQQHLAVWQQAIPNYFYLFATVIAFILFLLPRGLPGKLLGVIWLLPLILYQAPKPNLGEAWVDILDVGQGLSVVVQTRLHTLVYDAGPKFGAQDAGENVVTPFLHLQTIKQIDAMVISHGDNDHIGGASALIKNFAITTIFSSVPEKIMGSLSAPQLCLDGYSWQWDGVSFAFIYPSKDDLDANNDSSCVLKIDNGMQSLILPGDIEKYAEKELIKNNLKLLSTNYFVAPHHGSKTSGPLKFLEAVHPQVVFYATGYLNRYHFPHPSVVEAYTEMKTQQFNTANSGTLQFKLSKSSTYQLPIAYRKIKQRYCHDLSQG